MNKLLLLLAKGFGLGLSPVAPGTMGALLGIPLAYAVALLSTGWEIAVCAVLSVIAVPICEIGERELGRKDDRRIVADEYLTFPICLIGLPWREHLWLLGVAFVISRISDIIKPPPARQSQALAGGLGIVADDVLACLYTLAANHLVWWAIQSMRNA